VSESKPPLITDLQVKRVVDSYHDLVRAIESGISEQTCANLMCVPIELVQRVLADSGYYRRKEHARSE
jgi:hypothetical protein